MPWIDTFFFISSNYFVSSHFLFSHCSVSSHYIFPHNTSCILTFHFVSSDYFVPSHYVCILTSYFNPRITSFILTFYFVSSHYVLYPCSLFCILPLLCILTLRLVSSHSTIYPPIIICTITFSLYIVPSLALSCDGPHFPLKVQKSRNFCNSTESKDSANCSILELKTIWECIAYCKGHTLLCYSFPKFSNYFTVHVGR